MEKMPKWADVILIPVISLFLAAILSALVILATQRSRKAGAQRGIHVEVEVVRELVQIAVVVKLVP